MKIAAKIKESADSARQITVDVLAVQRIAGNLIASDPPTMPSALLAEVSSQLAGIAKTLRSAAKSYGESVDEIVDRIDRFIVAAQESSRSNWDKTRAWTDKFWSSAYGDAFDQAMATMPVAGAMYGSAGPLDASDVARGMSDAAVGLGEVGWMFSSMRWDPAQRKKFDTMVEAIGDDPKMVLEALVGLEDLRKVNWKDVAAGKKDPNLSHWVGGVGFDVALGYATAGVGTAASRGGKVAEAGSTAARRAWKEAAEKELAKVQGDLAYAQVTTNAAKLTKFSAGLREIYARNMLEHVAGGNPFIPFRADPDFAGAASNWSKAVTDNSEAGRRLVQAQRAEQAIDQRLTVAEIEFRAAARRLDLTHVDLDGITRALDNVNHVTQIVGLDVPLSRVQALLKAAQVSRGAMHESEQQ